MDIGALRGAKNGPRLAVWPPEGKSPGLVAQSLQWSADCCSRTSKQKFDPECAMGLQLLLGMAAGLSLLAAFLRFSVVRLAVQALAVVAAAVAGNLAAELVVRPVGVKPSLSSAPNGSQPAARGRSSFSVPADGSEEEWTPSR
jgi:hypothetical protein